MNQRRIVFLTIIIMAFFGSLLSFSLVFAVTKTSKKPAVIKTTQVKTTVKKPAVTKKTVTKKTTSAKTSTSKKKTITKKATKTKKKVAIAHKDKINTTIAPLIDPSNAY